MTTGETFDFARFLKRWDTSSPVHHFTILTRTEPEIDTDLLDEIWEQIARGKSAIEVLTADEGMALRVSLDDIDAALARLQALDARGGQEVSRAREKFFLYVSLFHEQYALPPDTINRYFNDALKAAGYLIGTSGSPDIARYFAHLHLACVEYHSSYLKEGALAAERAARAALQDPALPPLPVREIEGSLRNAAREGNFALSLLARVRLPVMARETLHVVLEESIDERFRIDAETIEERSPDGKRARVRIDVRLKMAQRIMQDLCRVYVRLKARDRARMCEEKLQTIPLGYRLSRPASVVAMEEDTWREVQTASENR